MSFLQHLSHCEQHDSNTFELSFEPSWTQGRTLFGGALGALAHHLMAKQLPPKWELRSIMVDFLAPTTADGVVVKIETIRKGRTLIRMKAQFYQNEKCCCVALAAFGATRSGAFHVTPSPIPPASPPSECRDFPLEIGPLPQFTQHFNYRWAKSNYPYSGSTDSVLLGWIQPKNSKVDMDYLIAMIDAWPPPILSLSNRPFPVSSVNWLLNLSQSIPPNGFAKDKWYLFESKMEFAASGCTDLAARLWDEDGRLLGISRQLLVEFSDKML